MKERNIPGPRRRGDRLIRERVHDPYKTRLKLPEPTVCPQCGSTFHGGRWTWDAAPDGAHEETCQACHRTNDKYPAGIVTLSGNFLRRHKTEILHLTRNTETAEKGARPLHRIMAVEERPDEIEITTTDIHLPRRIGDALRRAFEGDLKVHYDEDGYFVRVTWVRDD